jgi:mRNA-degrading endonuclease RelE of RelBE toxin-antitoxin system
MNLKCLHRASRPVAGGFAVQYTPTATSFLNGLPVTVREEVSEAVKQIAYEDPYAYGEPSLERDRRAVMVGGQRVVYVVSEPVRTVTVVNVGGEEA